MFTIEEFKGADGAPLRYGKLTNPGQPDNGRSLLFIPGLGGSVKGAIHFLEQLLPVFSTIYGPDLRGFGINPIDEPLKSCRIIREDLEAFHQQIGLDQHPDLSLMGLSLGGVYATLFAASHPERYKRLVLLAPAYKAHPKSFSLKYVVQNTLGCILQGPGFRTCLPYGIDAITQNETILNDPQYCEQPPLVLTGGFMLGLKGLCNEAFKKTAQISIPTMMAIPGQDVVCCPDTMREGFRRIPQSTPKVCREYPDFFHDVLFEAGHVQIADEIRDWSYARASEATSSSSM